MQIRKFCLSSGVALSSEENDGGRCTIEHSHTHTHARAHIAVRRLGSGWSSYTRCDKLSWMRKNESKVSISSFRFKLINLLLSSWCCFRASIYRFRTSPDACDNPTREICSNFNFKQDFSFLPLSLVLSRSIFLFRSRFHTPSAHSHRANCNDGVSRRKLNLYRIAHQNDGCGCRSVPHVLRRTKIANTQIKQVKKKLG